MTQSPDPGAHLPPATQQEADPDLRNPRRSWIVAAVLGAALAGLLAASFVVFAPAPPRFPVVLPDVVAPEASAAIAPSPSASAPLAVSVAPHDWPEVTGMDRAAALKTLARHDEELRGCWPEPPEYDPEVARPSLLVRITVKGDGKVREVELVEDDIQEEAVTACMERVLRGVRFPRAGGKDATVSMLWKF
jgi:hypothetical protein